MTTKNNYRILVVDDVASIHQDFRKILLPEESQSFQNLDTMNALLTVKKNEKPKLPPFEIVSAYQAQEAVISVTKAVNEGRPYALAFIDVQMPPGEDGIETTSRIWQIDPNIQIVICTAYAKYSWEDLIGRFGETDSLFVLKKPFDTMEIVQLACSLTTKWNLSHKVREQASNFNVPPDNVSLNKDQKMKASISSLEGTISELKILNEKLKNQNLLYKTKKEEEEAE